MPADRSMTKRPKRARMAAAAGVSVTVRASAALVAVVEGDHVVCRVGAGASKRAIGQRWPPEQVEFMHSGRNLE